MDFFEAMEKRHSYRGKYKPEAVPREHLHKVMASGLAAPSGCNKQTTTLIGVDDETVMARIWVALGRLNENWWEDPSAMSTAKAAVVVLTQKIIAHDDVSYYVEDYSAAIENMLLAITALGYASCWIEGEIINAPEKQSIIAELLNVPQGYHVVAVLPVGVPETQGRRPKFKAFEERASFNRFGG